MSKILIIDDDATYRMLLTAVLRSKGFTVVVAECGIEGVSMLRNDSDIRIVLLDLNMPDMDGYDTMQLINQTGLHSSLNIIAVTGNASDEEYVKCLEAGMTGFLTKPINTGNLYSLLERLCAEQSFD